jgi:integrase
MQEWRIAGLEWQDIDFKGNFVMVRRQRVLGRVQSTKTSSTRRIDLSSTLVDALKKLKLRRKEQWLAKGQTEIPPWVFLRLRGKPVEMHYVKRRQIRKCLEKAGLRRIRVHDLHTFATLLIINGEPIAYV